MSIADDLNEAMAPWLTPELIEYNNALGKMFEQVELLSDWVVVFDVDKCPDYALGYLGQFVGVRLIQGSSVESQRQQIRRPTRQDRGTVYAIQEAIKPLLTGNKSIVIRERDGASHADNAWRLTVITLDSETPDQQAVRDAIMAVKPAGIVLNYNEVLGQDWDSVDRRYATWAQVKADNRDWAEVKTRAPV